MEADGPIPMIRTAAQAIAATLPLGTIAYEAERDADEQINELLRVVDRDGDDEAPECRWAGGRTAGIDPLLPFKIDPAKGREAPESGLWLKASVAPSPMREHDDRGRVRFYPRDRLRAKRAVRRRLAAWFRPCSRPKGSCLSSCVIR
jgi:hypothetical protein